MADSAKTATVDANNNQPDGPKKMFPNGVPEDTKLSPELAEALKDLTMDDLIRGETPKDIAERCLELCKAYIAGSWTGAKSTDDIEVKRISGGMTNQLYHVQLKDTVPRVDNQIYPDEPLEVAIKLYQAKHMKNFETGENERLTDIIVLTIISEVGIGPKVFGIFNDGVILAYHKHEQFRPKQQQNPKLLKEVAQLLAKVHHLNVPIRKNKHWQVNEMRRMLETGYSNTDVAGIVKELNLEQFNRRDLAQEFEDFERFIVQYNAPQVLCHNDFRGSNILVTEPNEKILLCDLEYASYGARGQDIAAFLAEWNKELFEFDKFGMPEDSVIENFVQLYIDACDQQLPGYAAKPENSVKAMVDEVKVMTLANFMFIVVFMFKQNEAFIPQIPFDPKSKMTYVDKTYKSYFEIKDRLVKEGIFKQ